MTREPESSWSGRAPCAFSLGMYCLGWYTGDESMHVSVQIEFEHERATQ